MAFFRFYRLGPKQKYRNIVSQIMAFGVDEKNPEITLKRPLII